MVHLSRNARIDLLGLLSSARNTCSYLDLSAACESTVAAHAFLQLYVSADLTDVALRERWNLATRVLVDLGTYTWGSKEKRAKFAALAATPHVLAALQGRSRVAAT